MRPGVHNRTGLIGSISRFAAARPRLPSPRKPKAPEGPTRTDAAGSTAAVGPPRTPTKRVGPSSPPTSSAPMPSCSDGRPGRSGSRSGRITTRAIRSPTASTSFPRQTSEAAEAKERDFTPAAFRDGTLSRWRANRGDYQPVLNGCDVNIRSRRPAGTAVLGLGWGASQD
jgi:hypothetical protein